MSAPPIRKTFEFQTKEQWEEFVERLARAALMAYFDPNPSPVKTGSTKLRGSGHREQWSQFADMDQNNQRRGAARAVETVLQSEAHDEASGDGPAVDASEFEASPGRWQPEAKVAGGEWSTKLPEGRSAPHIRQGRVFGIFHDDAGNLTPFPIFYVDDKHAGMGPIYESHGVWSLDFFTPDGSGFEVNDDTDGSSYGGSYRLRFRKIPDEWPTRTRFLPHDFTKP